MAKPKTLRAVRPNAGLEAKYRRKVEQLVDEMHRSVDYWIRAAYRANEPEMALDKSPAMALRDTLRSLGRRWTKAFNVLARDWGPAFARDATQSTDQAFAAALRKAGFTVRFKMTPTVNDVMQATVGENVSLIRSIPAEYFTQVEGLVMRSVQSGRDLGTLTDELHARYGVTRRRAGNIARDQNNKATAVITRARQTELGITEALWLHSAGGKVPRPTHVAMNRKTYTIAEGMYDPAVGKRIWPGELISCRCVARSIIPGITRT